jgi:hypothetical protein
VQTSLQRLIAASVMSVTAVVTATAPIATAPIAAADNSEFCTTVSTSATKCERQGNVEVNDSLSRANAMPQWAAAGQQSGGPYGGTFGGGSR